jgi:RES domain-containing protein
LNRVYRVLRKKYARNPFDGEGAFRYGGRWSSPGTRLSYASEHQSLALLEYFVHLDKDDPPNDLVLAIAEIPDDLARARIEVADLPKDWRDPVAPPTLAQIGDEFVRLRRDCLLLVPSVLVPNEYNWLMNPEHSEYKRIVVQESEQMSYDARMFRKKPGSFTVAGRQKKK